MTLDYNRVIVKEMKGQAPVVWDFCHKENTPLEDIGRAMLAKIKIVKQYEEIAAQHADNPAKAREYTRKAFLETLAKYQIVTFDEFKLMQKTALCYKPIIEVTEEEYFEALEVLPPILYGTLEGVTMFCMSEMFTGSFTTQYARINGRYFSTMVDVTDRETWIYKRLNELPEVKQ